MDRLPRILSAGWHGLRESFVAGVPAAAGRACRGQVSLTSSVLELEADTTRSESFPNPLGKVNDGREVGLAFGIRTRRLCRKLRGTTPTWCRGRLGQGAPATVGGLHRPASSACPLKSRDEAHRVLYHALSVLLLDC
jgi:hypothetical protein